jgi:hypothetical protein
MEKAYGEPLTCWEGFSGVWDVWSRGTLEALKKMHQFKLNEKTGRHNLSGVGANGRLHLPYGRSD